MENKIASESYHWYDRRGNPRYEIPKKDGSGMRPTTLADAKKLNLLPSVTTILQMLPKPGLIIWQKKQVLMSALTLTRRKDENDYAYIGRIMADADEQARIAREKGTAIHGAIERFICGLPIEVEYDIYVQAVLSALKTHLDYAFLTKCKAEKSFANIEFGFGGKVDLHSRELNVVVDFKTKEFSADDDKKLAWDEQTIQLVAYRKGLEMPTARMINVYVSTNNPGLVRVIEHENDMINVTVSTNERYWNIFLICMKLWILTKKYNPVQQNGQTKGGSK